MSVLILGIIIFYFYKKYPEFLNKYWYIFAGLLILILLLIDFGMNTTNQKSDTDSKITTLSCGFKTVSFLNGKITQIIHEDGTIHQDVSNNWSYDGKAIKHSLGEVIPCGNVAKTRDEVINELSSRIKNEPELNGMDQSEADLMAEYTSELMKVEPYCYWVIGAVKSKTKDNMFFIDCNDQSSKFHRYWISNEDLMNKKLVKPLFTIPEVEAIHICNDELKNRTSFPSTYNPSLITGTSSIKNEELGRNLVEIKFSAKNAYGLELNFIGECVFESGEVLDVTANEI